MSGIDVGQDARGGIILGDKCSGEAAAVLAVAAGVAIHAADQLGQRAGSGGKRLQAGLKSRHQHGRGNALAGDVGNRHQKGLGLPNQPRTSKHIVIISGDGIGRTRGKGDLQAGHLRRVCRQQPRLNLLGDLQIAFHDHAVGDFQDQQQEHQQAAPEMGVKAEVQLGHRCFARWLRRREKTPTAARSAAARGGPASASPGSPRRTGWRH